MTKNPQTRNENELNIYAPSASSSALTDELSNKIKQKIAKRLKNFISSANWLAENLELNDHNVPVWNHHFNFEYSDMDYFFLKKKHIGHFNNFIEYYRLL